LQMKFESLQVPQTTCRTSAVRPRDQDDPHDDAHPKGENRAKRQKTSEYEAYVSRESSSGKVNKNEQGPEKQTECKSLEFVTIREMCEKQTECKGVRDFIKTAEASTDADEEVSITANIDGQSKTITEASLRRHLKLEDHDGITSIPNSEIFEQLALIGYQTNSDKLTFQKGVFSPQWRFLIHTLLHCLSVRFT
ncbi:hypothetical protein Tco_0022094, partial [Tanacetum coccineum]